MTKAKEGILGLIADLVRRQSLNLTRSVLWNVVKKKIIFINNCTGGGESEWVSEVNVLWIAKEIRSSSYVEL